MDAERCHHLLQVPVPWAGVAQGVWTGWWSCAGVLEQFQVNSVPLPRSVLRPTDPLARFHVCWKCLPREVLRVCAGALPRESWEKENWGRALSGLALPQLTFWRCLTLVGWERR